MNRLELAALTIAEFSTSTELPTGKRIGGGVWMFKMPKLGQKLSNPKHVYLINTQEFNSMNRSKRDVCRIISANDLIAAPTPDLYLAGGELALDLLGATEAVEELVIKGNGLHIEQIFPQFVFRL